MTPHPYRHPTPPPTKRVATGPSVGEQTMLTVDGKRFRCECGANVFTRMSDDSFSCNACPAIYRGER